MINKATVTPAEIKKGLGFNGELEDINIAVLDGGNQVRYSVIMTKADFLKAMNQNGTDVTNIEAATVDGNIGSVTFTVTGEVIGPVKRGRKAKPVTP